MNKLIMLLLGFFALAIPSTPALAQDAANTNFTGIRAELNAGVDDVRSLRQSSDINYGAAVGVDVPLGTRITVGVDGTAANVFENDRILGVGARLGLAVHPRVLLYGRAGYENYRDVRTALRDRTLDGLALGGGIEFALSRNSFVKLEGRYTDFERGAGRTGALVGAGLRF